MKLFSVVGDKSLSNTPKVAVPAKKSTLLRLASDPNHSFIDEFDRFVIYTQGSCYKSVVFVLLNSKQLISNRILAHWLILLCRDEENELS